MKTTILIPNYNGKKYIADCLESIRTAGEYPIIVVDNHSVDESDKIIEDYSHKEGFDITLIRLRENTGFCNAVNVGLKEIKTEYVFLLNNDTTIQPDAITALEKRMDEDRRIFSVQSRILTMLNHDLADDCGDYYSALGWAFARGKFGSADKYMVPVDIFAGCGAAVMYRMECFDDIGMFDDNHFAYLEDIDLGYRARIYGYRNVYEPTSVIFHAGSAVSGSLHNKFKVDLSSKNSIYLIYKNMPVLQIIINLPFLIIGYGIKICFFLIKGLGGAYLKGLLKGFRMVRDDISSGKMHKITYEKKHLSNYIRIQLELWINILRRFG